MKQDLSNRYKLDEYGCLELTNRGLPILYELPKDIKTLYCNGNEFKSLPELPEGLEVLYCANNKLKKLPKLPSTLIRLRCYHNKISHLPELPERLTEIIIHNNKISTIDNLPNGLVYLDCSSNKIKYLPKLPDGVIKFYCEYNPLKSLIPNKFLDGRFESYLYEYKKFINSYAGQKHILTNNPEQYLELKQQVNIHKRIVKEFEHLINADNLNLL